MFPFPITKMPKKPTQEDNVPSLLDMTGHLPQTWVIEAGIPPRNGGPQIMVNAASVASAKMSDLARANVAEIKEIQDSPPHYGSKLAYSSRDVVEKEEEIEINNDDLAALKFGDDIKILLLPAVDWRIICHFIGVQSIPDVRNAPYSNVPLLGLLLMECLNAFMKAHGYSFAGEIDFDDQGHPIPVKKQTWLLKKKEISFTRGGYLFFEHKSGNKKDNIVFYNYCNFERAVSGLTCYATDAIRAKKIVTDLESYTKKHNCIRGSKLRDVNMLMAQFEEVTDLDGYTWENYYYEPYIQEVMEMEVFGFLNKFKEYNKLGITKRGVLTHGDPGTGKTTLGKIICNLAGDKTVIWITPDLIAENSAGKHSVKLLYTLADFVSPTALILEDIDLWAYDRNEMGDTLRLGALMNILDGVNSVKNTVTIGMTNRIELIEKALRNRPGRFDVIVEVPSLTPALRTKMLVDRTKIFKVDDGVIDHVVTESDKWTGAYVQHFIHSVNMYFVQNGSEKHLTMEIAKRVLKAIKRFTFKEHKDGSYFHNSREE